jgi:tetratricopeptide (TPR) repeat protein
MTETQDHDDWQQIYYQLTREEKWVEARVLLLERSKQKPDSHWLLAQLAEGYYEERNYSQALNYSEQALQIAPHCPLVLWDYAGALDMLKRDEEAIQIYKKLIHRGVNRIAYGECSEGLLWARGVANDCHYRLGLLCARQSDFQAAGKYLKAHIRNRGRKCPSIYNLREVKKDYALILKGIDPRSI